MRINCKYWKNKLNTISVWVCFPIFIFLQSCIVYHQNPSSISEASQYNNRRIKIKTNDGEKYKLRWIKEKGDTVESIRNMKRMAFDGDKVREITTHRPEPMQISLDSALNYSGTLDITVLDAWGKDRSYTFIDIEIDNNQITGYYNIKRDTLKVVIPASQIYSIHVQNKGMTVFTNTVGSLLITCAILGGLIIGLWYCCGSI